MTLQHFLRLYFFWLFLFFDCFCFSFPQFVFCIFPIVQSEILTKHKLVRKVFSDWDISKPNKDFLIILYRKEAALLTCCCKIFLVNFITAKEAIWQDPTEQWDHAIKLNNWRLCLYYFEL